MRYQFFNDKFFSRLLVLIFVSVLIWTLFVVLQKSVEANTNIAFNENDHVGKFVEMGGRKWIVMDVINGKPYLMMDSIYKKRPWNSSGESHDASEIFQFLQDEFNNIITVAEDQDLIAETEWEMNC